MGSYLEATDLREGDIVSIDPYPQEKYEVVESHAKHPHYNQVGVRCKHLDTGDVEWFGGSDTAYTPDFVLHERG